MIKRGFVALLFIALFSIVFYVSLTRADNKYMNVSATIETPSLKIEIADSVYLGNVYPGYEGDWVILSINNTGEINARVTARLEIENDELFKNVCLRKTKPASMDDACSLATYNLSKFDMTLDRPDEVGGVNNKTIYAKLNLEDYTGLEYGVKSARIIFVAMPDK
ncbi:MAG: hypothetical protein KKE50_03700 [Nanoarchaeota archaeon]|nr:hypothetical protein [Nanoarchaeota archaeon]